MVKTQCKSNSESSEKQVLHATNNGKVDKKECGRCPLLTRATFILEAQVEKITWKAFLLSEQKRQQEEYVKYLEERLQDSEKKKTELIVVSSSHREEGDTICVRESVSCQTEQTTYPVGPVKEEVKVEVTSQTLPLTTNIEKGRNQNEVVTACEGVEYYDNAALEAARIRREKIMEKCGICFWCVKFVDLLKYSCHTKLCMVRRLARNTCYECGGVKMTHRNCSDQFKVVCNLCENFIRKGIWDKHASKCWKNRIQFHCTCAAVQQ